MGSLPSEAEVSPRREMELGGMDPSRPEPPATARGAIRTLRRAEEPCQDGASAPESVPRRTDQN
jgi:hypothetical protein